MGLNEFAKRVDNALFENARAAQHRKKVQAALKKPFVASLPHVNLLPQQVQTEIVTKKTTRKFVLGAAAILVAVGGVYTFQNHQVDTAQAQLDAAQTRNAQLAATQRELAPFSKYVADVQAEAQAGQAAMTQEVLTSQVVSGLYASAPHGVNIDSFTLSASAGGSDDGSGTACQPVDPFNTTAITPGGCLSISGTAKTRADIATWMDRIAGNDMFYGTFVPTTSFDISKSQYNFSAQIGLNAQVVHKNRYADPTFLEGATR